MSAFQIIAIAVWIGLILLAGALIGAAVVKMSQPAYADTSTHWALD